MQAEWMQRVGSSVPRGFSRHFILETLKKKPHTGKELINFAVKQSEGKWKPSPGLIYPLLGRLLDEKLIQETSGGKYKITKKGTTTADDLETINNIVKNVNLKLSMLFLSLRHISRQTLDIMVKMHIRSSIDYCIQVFGNSINRIQIANFTNYSNVLLI